MCINSRRRYPNKFMISTVHPPEGFKDESTRQGARHPYRSGGRLQITVYHLFFLQKLKTAVYHWPCRHHVHTPTPSHHGACVVPVHRPPSWTSRCRRRQPAVRRQAACCLARAGAPTWRAGAARLHAVGPRASGAAAALLSRDWAMEGDG